MRNAAGVVFFKMKDATGIWSGAEQQYSPQSGNLIGPLIVRYAKERFGGSEEAKVKRVEKMKKKNKKRETKKKNKKKREKKRQEGVKREKMTEKEKEKKKSEKNDTRTAGGWFSSTVYKPYGILIGVVIIISFIIALLVMKIQKQLAKGRQDAEQVVQLTELRRQSSSQRKNAEEKVRQLQNDMKFTHARTTIRWVCTGDDGEIQYEPHIASRLESCYNNAFGRPSSTMPFNIGAQSYKMDWESM